MILDINATVGPYPFRRLVATTASQFVERMQAEGVSASLVSSLPAVFYRDVHEGNRALIEEIRPLADRLFPVAVVNPEYVGWEQDLEQAASEWKVKGIALYPEHHGYLLNGPSGKNVLQRITDLGLPVVLTQRLEDRRQRHRWDMAEDLTINMVTEAGRAFPTLRFVLSNWIGLNGEVLRSAGLRGRCLIDIARLQVLLTHDVPRLIDTMGPEAIAFGSHAPFDYMGPGLVKLSNLSAMYPDEAELFAWKNAAGFLGLDLTSLS